MEKFELYFFIKPLIIIFIVAITLIVIQMFLKNLYNIEVLCIGGLLIVFGFYLLCTFLAISKDKFKNVSIDNENERFMLTAKNGQIMAIPFNNLEELGSATYSKAHENDADLNAVDYLVKCGYNPLAGISVLNKLSGTYPDLFTDHPSTDKRVQNIYNYVKEKYPQYISQGYNSTSYNQAIQSYIKGGR